MYVVCTYGGFLRWSYKYMDRVIYTIPRIIMRGKGEHKQSTAYHNNKTLFSEKLTYYMYMAGSMLVACQEGTAGTDRGTANVLLATSKSTRNKPDTAMQLYSILYAIYHI